MQNGAQHPGLSCLWAALFLLPRGGFCDSAGLSASQGRGLTLSSAQEPRTGCLLLCGADKQPELGLAHPHRVPWRTLPLARSEAALSSPCLREGRTLQPGQVLCASRPSRLFPRPPPCSLRASSLPSSGLISSSTPPVSPPVPGPHQPFPRLPGDAQWSADTLSGQGLSPRGESLPEAASISLSGRE